MIKGKYIFKSNGEVIAEKENVITANGLYMINKYLTNSAIDWAGAIVVGALETTSASTDTKLGFEVARNPVVLKSYTTTSGSNQIVLKSTLDPSLVATIYEVGVIPSNTVSGTNKDNFTLTNFDEVGSSSSVSDWLYGPTKATATNTLLTSSANSRVGAYNPAAVSTASVLTRNNFSFNVSQYNTADYLELLYFVPNGMTGTSPSVSFILEDTASVTWTSTAVNMPTTSSGYFTASFTMSGSPTAGFSYGIDRITASMTGGTGSVQFDSIKFMSGAVKPPELKLTSRSSTSTPLLTKTYGQSVDIEYYLTVT